ncbi:hypothetical protein DIPPA_33969 [Diplonema papillatum]|nr:hypothetical protein DIPPA_33969 [Diplonema papillatum]
MATGQSPHWEALRRKRSDPRPRAGGGGGRGAARRSAADAGDPAEGGSCCSRQGTPASLPSRPSFTRAHSSQSEESAKEHWEEDSAQGLSSSNWGSELSSVCGHSKALRRLSCGRTPTSTSGSLRNTAEQTPPKEPSRPPFRTPTNPRTSQPAFPDTRAPPHGGACRVRRIEPPAAFESDGPSCDPGRCSAAPAIPGSVELQGAEEDPTAAASDALGVAACRESNNQSGGDQKEAPPTDGSSGPTLEALAPVGSGSGTEQKPPRRVSGGCPPRSRSDGTPAHRRGPARPRSFTEPWSRLPPPPAAQPLSAFSCLRRSARHPPKARLHSIALANPLHRPARDADGATTAVDTASAESVSPVDLLPVMQAWTQSTEDSSDTADSRAWSEHAFFPTRTAAPGTPQPEQPPRPDGVERSGRRARTRPSTSTCSQVLPPINDGPPPGDAGAEFSASPWLRGEGSRRAAASPRNLQTNDSLDSLPCAWGRGRPASVSCSGHGDAVAAVEPPGEGGGGGAAPKAKRSVGTDSSGSSADGEGSAASAPQSSFRRVFYLFGFPLPRSLAAADIVLAFAIVSCVIIACTTDWADVTCPYAAKYQFNTRSSASLFTLFANSGNVTSSIVFSSTNTSPLSAIDEITDRTSSCLYFLLSQGLCAFLVLVTNTATVQGVGGRIAELITVWGIVALIPLASATFAAACLVYVSLEAVSTPAPLPAAAAAHLTAAGRQALARSFCSGSPAPLGLISAGLALIVVILSCTIHILLFALIDLGAIGEVRQVAREVKAAAAHRCKPEAPGLFEAPRHYTTAGDWSPKVINVLKHKHQHYYSIDTMCLNPEDPLEDTCQPSSEVGSLETVSVLSY